MLQAGTTPVIPVNAALDPFTKLLMHAEVLPGTAATGNTSLITDATGLHGNAAIGGVGQISAAGQGYLGATSLYLNGASYVVWPDSADWEFGSGDFTVDWWEYRTAATASSCVLVRNANNQTYQAFIIGYTEGTVMQAYLSGDGASWAVSTLPLGPVSLNVWHHYAVVRQGSTFYGFRDGVLQGTRTYAGALMASSGPLSVGLWNPNQIIYASGYFDELRVSKGIARWTQNFPVPTGKYGPDANKDFNTVLLLHGDGANGSNVFTDASPGRHGNATIGGTVTVSTAQSKFGGGSIFNQGYLTFPVHSDFNFAADDFTVDWWEYRTGTGCSIARDLGTTYCPFLLSFSSNGEIYMSGTGNSWDIANGSGGLPAPAFGPSVMNGWSHLAVTRSGSTFRAFRDGVQKSTWTSAAAIIANGNALCIGAAQNGQNLQGYLDEIRISKGIARWTANFTPPTLPYLTDPVAYSTKLLLHCDGAHQGTVFPDSSGFHRGNATVGGGAVTTTNFQKFGSASAYFSGTSTYITFPNSADFDWAGTSDFTIEAWVNLQAINADSSLSMIASRTGSADYWIFYIEPSNKTPVFGLVQGGTFTAIGGPGPVPVGFSGWAHVAAVRYNGNGTLYVNGVGAGVVAMPAVTSPGVSINGPLNIGAYAQGAHFFNGCIDELRISNGVARYTTNFTPPTAPFS